METVDSILSTEISSLGTEHSEQDNRNNKWMNRKITLYRLDFRLKLKLDQFSILFPLKERKTELFDDPEARNFWNSTFGEKMMMVPLGTFMHALESKLEEQFEDDDKEILKEFIDFTQDNFVTPFEFNVFLRWFGPMTGCIRRLIKPLKEGLLSGLTPAIEADQLLRGKSPGTYLIRFSKTQVGSYAVTFTDSKGGVRHVLLFSVQPAGVTLRNPPEVYSSLTNFARTHINKLKAPVGNEWLNHENGKLIKDHNESLIDSPDIKRQTGTTLLEPFPPQPKPGEVMTCTVCMDERIQTVFLECGHLACCKNCSSKLRDCPICRQQISRVVTIFMT